MKERFYLPAKPLLSGLFCMSDKTERAVSKLCVLRVGASCDYAQNRRGPVPFMLGAIMPATAQRRKENLPKAEILTPALMIDGFDFPVRIAFNAHLTVTMVPDEFNEWPPLCRLRESLLMQITSHGAHHSTRPAIISFSADGH